MKERFPAPILSPEKQELLGLEKSGLYVFHGSPQDLETLAPRQAIDVHIGPDRNPAVFATPAVDLAIFNAVLKGKNKYSIAQSHILESGADTHDDGSFDLKFSVPRLAWDTLLDSASGWVYVFDRHSFNPISDRPAEYESTEEVKPIKKIKVGKMDLPGNIEIK